MRRAEASRLQIQRLAICAIITELKFGLTHEFLNRRDGWRPLAERYQLHRQHVIGIDHGLGYAALQNGSIDIKDAYSTDAKIADYDLVTLEDDLKFFPQYQAVFLYNLSLPPPVVIALQKLEGTLAEPRMIQLNAEAERTKNYARAADLYFQTGTSTVRVSGESFQQKLTRWITRHLELAGFSLLLAVVVGFRSGSSPAAAEQSVTFLAALYRSDNSVARTAPLLCDSIFRISPRTAIAGFSYGCCQSYAIPRRDCKQPPSATRISCRARS